MLSNQIIWRAPSVHCQTIEVLQKSNSSSYSKIVLGAKMLLFDGRACAKMLLFEGVNLANECAESELPKLIKFLAGGDISHVCEIKVLGNTYLRMGHK